MEKAKKKGKEIKIHRQCETERKEWKEKKSKKKIFNWKRFIKCLFISTHRA